MFEGSGTWRKVKSLFLAALDHDAPERLRFVDAADASSTVRGQARQLLDADAHAGSFMHELPLPEETVALTPAPTQFGAGEMLGTRYQIRRYIARGGMGEVYEADDLELEVVVAIKTLRPGVFSGSDSLARFKREIDLARRVTHPNIGRIFDFGRHVRPNGEQIPFLTMEFLRGETLAERIARTGPLMEPEARALIEDIVEALDAIHRNGIVHRDFKSANVMLVEDHGRQCAKVMDFGLARPTVPGDATLTRSGFISGTPAYMAPEQFENVSTPASDFYALGVVMHEMLRGSRPRASGAAPNANGRPISAALGGIMHKCLSIDPVDRFQSADELLVQLRPRASGSRPNRDPHAQPRVRRWVWIAGALGILALVAGVLSWTILGNSPDDHTPKHVAVLPIHNDSGISADDAFCGGFSDTVRGDLAQMEGASTQTFWIIPSSEVRTIKTAAQAYRQVGATLVIEATFHRMPQSVSLTAEIVDAKNLHILKAITIEADSLPALRERTLKELASLIGLPEPSGTSQDVTAGTSRELGAFEYYEQGLGYLHRNGVQSMDNAASLFTKAIQKDSKYALAYAGLGEAYARKYQGTRDPAAIELASENGRKAIALDQRLAQVHSTAGQIFRLTGQSKAAVEEFKKAIRIEPFCTSCYFHLGETYIDQHRLADAESSFEAIIHKQRGNWMGYSGLAKVREMRGRFQDAVNLIQQVIELAPDNVKALANLGGVYLEMGRFEDAARTLRRAIQLSPDGQACSNLGAALMYLKRYEEAASAMEEATRLMPENHDYWRNLGDSYHQVPALSAKADSAYRTALVKVVAALQVNPGDADLLSSKGLYEAHLGDARAAARSIQLALDKGRSNPQVLFTAGLAYELAGQRDLALKSLDAAAKAGYSLSLIESEPELARLYADPRYRRWAEEVRRRAKA